MNLVEKSFMKSLFFGEINEELIFPYPRLSFEVSESVRMITDAIHRFSKDSVRSSEWDQKGAMPFEIVSQVAELGMMGMGVPEEYGGLGLPQSGYARVFQEISAIDGSLAATLGAHQSIGYKAILLFGTEEQKKRFLPDLASGKRIASYCLTEPGSGSDAASIKTRADLSSDGSHYVLNGNKLWITNAGIAKFMTVFAKTPVEDPQNPGEKKEKVTCFVLELPAEGVSVGPSEHKLGIRSSWTNAVHFENVKIPIENVVGAPGKGFKIAMGVLNHGRLGLAAGCVGMGKKALKASIEHANERVQFKKKIGEFGLIKDKIARMATSIYVAESMVYMTTSLIDRGDVDYSIESAIAKVYASEMLWEVVDENLQLWGGAGYMKEYPFEHWLRDARINRIFEGTNEILRAFIALSGLQGRGQELSDLAEAIKQPLKGLGLVTDFAARKIRQNVFGQSISKTHPKLKQLASLVEEYSVQFASQAEVLLRKYGKNVHLEQMSQKRLADIAIDLFGMSCVLSRVTREIEEKGTESCELEMNLAQIYFMSAKRRIKGNLKAMSQNENKSIEFVSSRLYELGEYPFEGVLQNSK